MALSNIAIPKYYGKFRDDVIHGRFPVCKNISLEMNRIDRLIRDQNIYYDPAPVEGWINFCESELTLTDGSDLHLLDSFKVWGEQVHGWYYFIDKSVYRPYKNGHGGRYVRRKFKKRLTNRQYLIVARGAAKTLYGECHQAYGLVVDNETTHQVTSAPTMKQAEEILNPFRTAITRARGPVFKLLTRGSIHNTTGSRDNRSKLVSTKKGIENFLTGSYLEVRPMSIAKLQGLQNKYSTVDEWLSGDIREDVIGALEQGAAKVNDYIIISMSSEGTIRNSVGDTIKMELTDILNGVYNAPNVSIWWYCLDDIKEVSNPEMWVKANPNLGFTVEYETYQREVERAEKVPAARNDILAKRFGIPMEGFTYFFTYEETRPSRKKSMWRMCCSLGADLSQGDDFCAFTFLFPIVKGFHIKVRSYITERTLKKLSPAMREEYEQFIKEGTLIVMPGTVLNMIDVYEDLDQFITDMSYIVVSFGYDPYNAKEFVERWVLDNGDHAVEKVPQGVKTESVPLGEIKKMFEDKLMAFDEILMSFSMGNAIVQEDTNGNKKLCKKRIADKIDNVSALLDAYVAYKLNLNEFE